jgi:hypothetical protein
MKSRETPIRIGQFARIEEDKRPGFHTKFLVDRQGCPACGNITRYEVKPPTMPAVSTCEHCTGLENGGKALGSGDEIWIFNYTYTPHTDKSHSQAPKKDPDFVFTLTKNGTTGQPFTISVTHQHGLLFEESCTQRTINWLMYKLALKTDSWSRANLKKPLQKCTFEPVNKVIEYSDEQISRMFLRAVHSTAEKTASKRPSKILPRPEVTAPRKTVQADLFSFFPQEATA